MSNHVIVYGPPCSGKNWYVNGKRKPGDVVIDYDAIMAMLTLKPKHERTEAAHWLTQAAWSALVTSLSRDGYQGGTAWVIGAFMDHSNLVRASRSIQGCTTVLVDPGIDVCLERASRRLHNYATMQAVNDWYGAYRRAGALPLRSNTHTSAIA